MLSRTLLACGILASAVEIAANIIVPLRYPGYSAASQVVSELSAIDAPTRSLWSTMLAPYAFLMLAFGIGIWISARESKLLRASSAIIIAATVLGAFWPPMHRREVLAAGGGTQTDTLHIVFTVIWAASAMATMVLTAFCLGPRFRLFTIVMMSLLISFGVWTGLQSPAMQSNLPTPWIGVAERINMASYFCWLVAFAVVMMRRASRI